MKQHSSSTFISAVIPTYNRKMFVARAIRSILVQDVQPDEIIVIDDGSTDGTGNYLQATFGDVVKVVSQPNGGVSSARRRGVQEACGEWIAFLDSDDEWTPGRMAVLRSAALSLPEDVSWLFGDTQIITDDDQDQKIQTVFSKFGLSINEEINVFSDTMATQFPFQFGLLQSSLIRREALLSVDAFSEDLYSSEDFLVGFTIALKYGIAAVPHIVTRLYRTNDLAASSLDRLGRTQPDYHRARMIAFGLAIRAARSGSWSRLYEEGVRGYCISLARLGRVDRRSAFQQFRYRISLKSIAFACASILGARGIRAWEQVKVRAGHQSHRSVAVRPT